MGCAGPACGRPGGSSHGIISSRKYESQPSYHNPGLQEYQAIPGLGFCSAGDRFLACRTTFTWGDYFTYVDFGRQGYCGFNRLWRPIR